MLTWLLYVAADALARALPAPLADRCGVAIARLVFALRLPARRRLEENLARLMGPVSTAGVSRAARDSFDNFALGFVDFLRLGHGGASGLAEAVEVHGSEHLAAARASGRGVILLSAHLGNWELGAAWLATAGPPVNLVARPHPSARVDRFYEARRRSWGVRTLPERPLWSSATAALRRHEWVAVMADRGAEPTAAGSRRPSVCAWAAALARRTGAVVLPAVIVRLPGRRYAAHFEPPIAAAEMGGEGFAATLRGHLQRHPRQWFAFEPLPEGLA
jgi:Kdo2-lipid IVA lauroyltransferase/acyltransferase